MLYVRMFLSMLVTLYTSRVVLSVLGIEDFGIYYVVTGFVALLGFLQGAMTTATQRYFAFDIGEASGKNLTIIFTSSFQIHLLLAIVIIIVAETAGYWFVITQLTIPTDRLDAALWAYHLAVAAFAISVLMVPYTAMLMAHERMGIFAAISMADVLLKLSAVLSLQVIGSDKLITYSSLLLTVVVFTFTAYIVSNIRLFPNVSLRWRWHSNQFQIMLSYTAWNTWGSFAAAMSMHGTNILLNIFFGPAVNASRTIATMANSALNSFIQNVQVAINPQIIKSYASGNINEMHSLVLHASKYNFYLLFILAIPVLFNTEALLTLWLTEVPPYAVVFLRLTIIASLIDSFSGPLMVSAQATGHIRAYQTIIGSILLLNVPISYLTILQWNEPETVVWVSIILAISALIIRLIILNKLTKLAVSNYVTDVLLRSLYVSLATISIIYFCIPSGNTALTIVVSIIASTILTVIIVCLIGLNTAERLSILYYSRQFINHINR